MNKRAVLCLCHNMIHLPGWWLQKSEIQFTNNNVFCTYTYSSLVALCNVFNHAAINTDAANVRFFSVATAQQATIVNNNNSNLNINIVVKELASNDAWLIHGELFGVPTNEHIAVAVS